jgi:DNA-directed RNA polymerase specialized sigma24 family protein
MAEADTDRKQRFDALFAAHRSDVVAYCGWRASSASDAQDATAEVFLTAWRRLDDVPEGDARGSGCTRPPGGCSPTSGERAAGGSR